MSNKISIIGTKDNITINQNGEVTVVSRLKNEEVFTEVYDKIVTGDLAWIEENYQSIKDRIAKLTNGMFEQHNSKVVLKGTTIPVPDVILKKLQELEGNPDSLVRMTALLRFWRKLSDNPSENSRNDLYVFMTKNNIPLSDDGDIVVEKGVNQKRDSYPFHLVDCRTGTIDNSVGMEVAIPRDKVNADSSQTCSYGLHVGAPDYVRNIWSSDVIVECTVNPMDVVSVPKDYNATKMRVCRYKVMGYSSKSRVGEEVVSLKDFVATPLPEYTSQVEAKSDVKKKAPKKKKTKAKVKKTNSKAKKSATTKAKKDKKVENTQSTDNPYVGELNGMVARDIVAFVKDKTGEEITFSLKSKKSIYNKAIKLLTLKWETELIGKKATKEVVTTEKIIEAKLPNPQSMTKRELISFAKSKFNEKLDEDKSHSKLLTQVLTFCKKGNVELAVVVNGVRTQEEIDRQVEGLRKEKESIPELNTFNENNWEVIDAQIAIIMGDAEVEDYVSDSESETYVEVAVQDAQYWLDGDYGDDLFG